MAAFGRVAAVYPIVLRNTLIKDAITLNSACFSSGEWGSGAGKGGGSGGAVRDAGGVFGKMEAAREEEYFKKLQRKQLMKMKDRLKEEISHHEKIIAQHQEAISRHKERICEIKKEIPPKPEEKLEPAAAAAQANK